jgi:hypothetical protein
MLNCPDYSPGRFARVRTVFTVAPTEALRAMQRRMPHSVMVNAYGVTEFGGSVVMVDPADDDDARLATQGPPFPGLEIGIRDSSGQAVPPGGRGEIVIRGPSMFERYHNDPAKTAEAIDADGWYHSGDLGTVGDDGRLRYLGRLKDMLKVGGENVAAIEIASHLQAHPAVAVAHVTGVADEKDGEVAAAFIELSPGAALTRRRSSRTAGPGWPASRSRATSGSSPSGRCPPPRCRRSGCASSSKPSWPPAGCHDGCHGTCYPFDRICRNENLNETVGHLLRSSRFQFTTSGVTCGSRVQRHRRATHPRCDRA